MLYQPGQTPTLAEALASDDAYASMLTEVDFKWLLAGEGQWIDVIRFRCDFSYAADLIRVALLSPSFALRECAAVLQTQNNFAVSQT